ncbi:uncharacterized protein LOC128660608 isoform X2 [Bombina bombina]|uniref:uncharacterized protein LOC128660608 isoform X2 n=1 Tax=Bombina bombina TaxID=8345 RepID=UPI00235B1322|nr:uncharacterized protein LOC128660608 isoform X2 [Bombina bombina]
MEKNISTLLQRLIIHRNIAVFLQRLIIHWNQHIAVYVTSTCKTKMCWLSTLLEKNTSLPSCKSDNTANKSDEERMQKKSSIKLEETRPPIKRDANLKGEDPKNENSPQFESIQELQEFLTNYKIENEEDAAFAYQTSRLLSNLVLSYTSRRKIKVGGKQAKIPKVEPVSTFDNENVLRSQEEEKQAETPKVEPVQKSYNENILLRSQEEEKQEETPNVEHVPTFDIGGFYGVLNNKSEEEIKSSIQELTEILKQQLPSM